MTFVIFMVKKSTHKIYHKIDICHFYGKLRGRIEEPWVHEKLPK